MRLVGNNVGIGINNPSQKLHVNGNGIFSNRLAIGTGISSTYKLNVYGSILARNP